MSKTVIVAGWHGVEAALSRPDVLPRRIWLEQGRSDERARRLTEMAAGLGVAVERVDAATLHRRSEGATHQGVLAEVPAAPTLDESDLEEILDGVSGAPLLLCLDGVQDPHNLGASLRVAAAAGVHAVIVPRDKSASLTPAARKAAAGADFLVPLITVTNLARTLDQLKARGIWLIGAAGEATQSIHEVDSRGAVAWVMGSEGSGLRRLTSETCDYLARIPMAEGVESLNVSTAAAVCLFESVRQRRG